MTAPQRLSVESGAHSIYAEVWGSAGPTLILGHGFGGSARNFRPQARALARENRVVLFDARGHARSSAPRDAEAYQPECFVADVLAVLDRVGAARAIVGGLSMGAGVALRFAISHPERVSGLVLSAFPRAVEEPAHVPWALGFADAIEKHGIESAGAELIWGRFDDKTADLIRRGFIEHSPHGLVNTLRELIAVQPGPASMPELPGLAIPTLVVVGSLDSASLAPCRVLAERIPGAEWVEIAGGGHIINLSHGAEYNGALRGFLSRIARPAGAAGSPSGPPDERAVR